MRGRIVLAVDTNVLAARSIHQLLGTLGVSGSFDMVWSEQLLDELVSALERPRQAGGRGWSRQAGLAVAGYVKSGFPETMVTGADLATEMTLALSLVEDARDAHVVALAVAGSASHVITDNVRDFRGHDLAQRGIQLMTPDTLLLELLRESQDDVIAAVVAQVEGRTTHPATPRDLLGLLHRSGCTEFAAAVAAVMGLSAPDDADANATSPGELLDALPGALGHARLGLRQAQAGETVGLDAL